MYEHTAPPTAWWHATNCHDLVSHSNICQQFLPKRFSTNTLKPPLKVSEVCAKTRASLVIIFVLTSLWHLMAPSALPDVCLKENMTLADRLYNLQLIQDFCKDNLNSCCHFSLEDMLYASSAIKVLLQPGCIHVVSCQTWDICDTSSLHPMVLIELYIEVSSRSLHVWGLYFFFLINKKLYVWNYIFNCVCIRVCVLKSYLYPIYIL